MGIFTQTFQASLFTNDDPYTQNRRGHYYAGLTNPCNELMKFFIIEITIDIL